MKQLGYYFFKYWVSAGLFFYYRRIKVIGIENIPKNTPVIFLSNHQNALLDIFLIATSCKRKPWYLTRADVFKNQIFRPLFRFLQMLPIYRLRDGKKNLSKNKFTFNRSAELLMQGEAILLFPEANHSLQRRVRPLSKGFTRIIDAALKLDPHMDLALVPVGQNYQTPTQAGDEATLYFGKPIKVHDFIQESDFVSAIKHTVFNRLTQLTTHIELEDYELTLEQLELSKVDFTNPEQVNDQISKKTYNYQKAGISERTLSLARLLFQSFNLPFILLWRLLVKPKVPEPEFEATFRFGFALVAYPLVYLLGFGAVGYLFTIKMACLWVFGHAVFNIFLVRIGVTSSAQRK